MSEPDRREGSAIIGGLGAGLLAAGVVIMVWTWLEADQWGKALLSARMPPAESLKAPSLGPAPQPGRFASLGKIPLEAGVEYEVWQEFHAISPAELEWIKDPAQAAPGGFAPHRLTFHGPAGPAVYRVAPDAARDYEHQASGYPVFGRRIGVLQAPKSGLYEVVAARWRMVTERRTPDGRFLEVPVGPAQGPGEFVLVSRPADPSRDRQLFTVGMGALLLGTMMLVLVHMASQPWET